MTDQTLLDAPPAIPLFEGPLITAYDQANANGTLAIGTYAQFVEIAGVPLVGSSGQVVALISEDNATALKVASRLVRSEEAPGGRRVLRFEGGEHTAIGDGVTLWFSANDPGQPAKSRPLGLPNGLSLTYGQILALGGDFYGIPDSPISDGMTFGDRIALFNAAFSTLAADPSAVAEAGKILEIMQKEITAVNKAVSAGESPSKVYERFGDSLSAAWNKATGGGCFFSDWIPSGRYLELAMTNWDHFGQYAVMAYQAGHAAAMGVAIQARSLSGPAQVAQMALAYANNAFADHFLSDLFSAGHVRDPRKEIYATSTEGVTANLCAKGMHDEDSKFGLMVSNAVGDTWRVYGDKRYFDTIDLKNRAQVERAVQASVTEVYKAFLTGAAPDPSAYQALQIAPNIAQAQDYQTNPLGNFAPMFVLNGAAVQSRINLNDLNSRSWTSVWSAGAIAAFLRTPAYRPNNPTGYIAAPTAAPAIGAQGWGSSQPILPNWVGGAQVRYFVSFTGPNFESDLGPPCAYYPLSNQFQPMLVDVPTGPAGVTGRVIYREFLGSPIGFCGTIPDNTTTTFTDRTN